MKIYNCWRCKKRLPFLNEKEWADLQPYIKKSAGGLIGKYDDALRAERVERQKSAVKKVEELTGETGISFYAIGHHRLEDWGPECSGCGELLRTPKSSFCANCGKRK